MSDRLEAWNDGSAICVIAVGSHGDPVDLGEDEVRDFISRLEKCLAGEQKDFKGNDSAANLRESWATTLRHLAASRYYLPKALTSGKAKEAERAWSNYLHANELELALWEAEHIGLEERAPAEFWNELRLAAASMRLEDAVANFAAQVERSAGDA
jgi:hypothetical protein